MDQNLVYAKTSTGDEAVRQSTRVVQRNLRMVLVQVDGKTSVAELSAKIGNSKLVETALHELEQGGFIAPVMQALSVWESSKKVAQEIKAAASQFSTFGPRSVAPKTTQPPLSAAPTEGGLSSGLTTASVFSAFSKPVAAAPMQADQDRPVPEDPPRRISLPTFRIKPGIVFRALLILLVLACIGVVVYPYEKFKPDIEAALGRSLQLPVRIGSVGLEWSPKPAFALRDVRIGAKEEVRVQVVRISSLQALVGSAPRRISQVEVSGVDIPVEGLAALLGNGKAGTGQAQEISVERVRLERMTVKIGDAALQNLDGDMVFRPDGRPEKLRLRTENGSLQVEAVPAQEGVGLRIEGQGWKVAEDSPYVFDVLLAKGLVQPGRLVINDIDANFLGGALKGNWLLTWGDGMAMAGEGSVAHMSMRRMVSALAPQFKMDGELSGPLRLRGSGKDWLTMWASTQAALDADIVHGTVTGVDLGEAARRGGVSVRGGATKFDRLRGNIQIDPRQVVGRDIRMEAGLVSAQGRFVADRENKVDGQFDVAITSSVAGVRMPLKVSGALPDLVVSVGR